jgi:PAS domain S-box-containing protein
MSRIYTHPLQAENERLKTELSAARRQYRQLLDSIETGFCIIEMKFDEDGRPCDYRFIETNRVFEQHTGLVDAKGKWIRDMVPDQDQHWYDVYGKVADTGEAIRFEHYGVALRRWFEVHATAISTEQKIVAVLFTDITARRNAELALRQSEEYWRGIFERLEDGFILGELIREADGTVSDWRYLDVNPAWAELVGVTNAEVKGRTVRELFPDVENFWIDEVAAAVNQQKTLAFNHQVAGIKRWFEGRVHPLEDDRFTIIFQEVTEAHRALTRRQALLELSDVLRDMQEPEQMAYSVSATLGSVLECDGACYLSVSPDGLPVLSGRVWPDAAESTLEELWHGNESHWFSTFSRYARPVAGRYRLAAQRPIGGKRQNGGRSVCRAQ